MWLYRGAPMLQPMWLPSGLKLVSLGCQQQDLGNEMLILQKGSSTVAVSAQTPKS